MNREYSIGIVVILAVAITLFIINSGSPEKCGDGICGKDENWMNCLKDCPKPVKPVCGDKICNSGEDSKSCPQDCPITSKCGDGICDTKELANPSSCSKDCTNKCGNKICESGETCSNCNSDCGNCPVVSGESRFGVHLGFDWLNPFALHNEISELGDIYVRGEILSDSFGWKQVKGDPAGIQLCRSCCDSSKSSCSCNAGDIYYCEADSRDNVIKSYFMDFYTGNFKMLVTVGASRYDDIVPKSILSDYPTNKEDIYEDYLQYLTQNTADKVKYWEIQNEPDYSLFWAGTSESYAGLVQLASNKIKADCPDCRVGISFASPNPASGWFNAIGRACNSFDFIDAHYYKPSLIADDELNHLRTTCPGKEFISTETGIPDADVYTKSGAWEIGGTRDKQAQDLVKYITTMFNAGYNKIYWYLIDHNFNPSIPDDLWEHAGLLTESHEKKPAFYSYKTMINKVDHFTSITRLTEGQYKYTFADKNPVYVLWCDSVSCSLPSEIQGTVKVTDYSGNEETKNASEIVLTDSPIYVE